MMEIIHGGVITDVKGFMAAGIAAGLKKSGKKDMALIYSEYKAVAAATFTKNLVKGAPVLVSMANISSDNTQAIIVNSGNANACTGQEGYANALTMVEKVANRLNLKPNEVLVNSTGIIGVPLTMPTIEKGIDLVVDRLSTDGFGEAAEAIMTTDTGPKMIAVKIQLSGKTVTMAGLAKGSGMIHPNMATMLSFVVTDAKIDKRLLQKAFTAVVEDTYNMISVDGDTSTNDMAAILANGAADNEMLVDEHSEDFKVFKEALLYVNTQLAMLIAEDGEGATKLIAVTTCHAKTKENAKQIAKTVVTSSLFKAAVFGADANWGRILCAVGYAGVPIEVDNVAIYIEGQGKQIKVAEKGRGVAFNEVEVKQLLAEKKVGVIIDLNEGTQQAIAWGCDLTYDYVKINADYRT